MTKYVWKAVGLVAVLVFLGASSANAEWASGYPMLAVISTGDVNVVVAGNFDDTFYSHDEAQNISSQIASLAAMLSGTDAAVFLVTPDELQSYDIDDFQKLDELVDPIYRDAGFDFYVILNILKAEGLAGYGDGQNIVVEVWVDDMGTDMGLPTSDLYVGTIAVPSLYLPLIDSL